MGRAAEKHGFGFALCVLLIIIPTVIAAPIAAWSAALILNCNFVALPEASANGFGYSGVEVNTGLWQCGGQIKITTEYKLYSDCGASGDDLCCYPDTECVKFRDYDDAELYLDGPMKFSKVVAIILSLAVLVVSIGSCILCCGDQEKAPVRTRPIAISMLVLAPMQFLLFIIHGAGICDDETDLRGPCELGGGGKAAICAFCFYVVSGIVFFKISGASSSPASPGPSDAGDGKPAQADTTASTDAQDAVPKDNQKITTDSTDNKTSGKEGTAKPNDNTNEDLEVQKPSPRSSDVGLAPLHSSRPAATNTKVYVEVMDF